MDRIANGSEGSSLEGSFYFTELYPTVFFSCSDQFREIILPFDHPNWTMIQNDNAWIVNMIILGKKLEFCTETIDIILNQIKYIPFSCLLALIIANKLLLVSYVLSKVKYSQHDMNKALK